MSVKIDCLPFKYNSLYIMIAVLITTSTAWSSSLTNDAIAKELGWVNSASNNCGGFYLEEPIKTSLTPTDHEAVSVTMDGGLLSQRSTSLLEGHVTVTRSGQQMTANRAYLYRDPVTGKLTAIDMIGNVHLRESHSLVLAKKGRYNFDTTSKSLIDIIYRTSLDPLHNLTQKAVQTVRSEDGTKTANLTAWGKADEFSQVEPKVYELYKASYTTCPPVSNPAWQVRASHLVLNKNTGRGYATNARVLVRNIPVFYLPYINFPIDKQRKTGFLWPLIGVQSNKWGPYVQLPFYWNMAPNYDMTITPGFLSKRGVLLGNKFRYLTDTSDGELRLDVLPNDRAFQKKQENAAVNPKYVDSTNPIIQAELNRLLSSSLTRGSFYWHDDSRFNMNWSSHVDFNVVSDDYYLQDFGRTVNEISKNWILQEADLYYKNPHWDFTGRLQAYQTVHPIDSDPVLNVYRRLPQLVLNGDYPDQKFGLEYFISNEATRFDILKTPGTAVDLPVGNRFNVQPGISLPLYWPYFYINPRIQVALTAYNLYQTSETLTPTNINRSVPIFDIASGFSMTRNANIFHQAFTQTLEPQFYYVYIPYRNQKKIPTFDTTVNTLVYDQIFNYNRFTGIDRIGDANQLGVGVTSRFIDQESGFEKVRIGVGTIVYFAERRVTLCNDPLICVDNPTNSNNRQTLSPVAGVLNYHINPVWSLNLNSIWNPISKQLDNSTIAFQYLPDAVHLLNLSFTYARNGDILSGIQTTESINNLKVTDISFAWPLFEDISVVGRWSQNWNRAHLQNLIYGLQYDSCCWAMRIVGGRAFQGFDPSANNNPKYTSEVSIQFSLKGLGDIGTGNPANLLSGIPGYKSQFGQELS